MSASQKHVFEVVGETPWPELEEMLREVPLYKQPDTRPYEHAQMSIQRVRLSQLAPTTRHIQEDLLAMQSVIRASLLPQGYDQLDLRDGGLMIKMDGLDKPRRIIPPIVERYEDVGMDQYVIDGSHRTHLARQVGILAGKADPELTVIYIRDGIGYPPYASPNPWGEVEVVAERPEDQSTWKNYEDYDNRYALYRDYNHIVPSSPRGDTDS